MNKQWSVYILRCADGSFYTGATNDVNSRLDAHNRGRGAKYTAGRRPCDLIYVEECTDISHALKREHEIKQLRRIDKGRLAKRYADANDREYVGARLGRLIRTGK